jgi:hypothetical protein
MMHISETMRSLNVSIQTISALACVFCNVNPSFASSKASFLFRFRILGFRV